MGGLWEAKKELLGLRFRRVALVGIKRARKIGREGNEISRFIHWKAAQDKKGHDRNQSFFVPLGFAFVCFVSGQ